MVLLQRAVNVYCSKFILVCDVKNCAECSSGGTCHYCLDGTVLASITSGSSDTLIPKCIGN